MAQWLGAKGPRPLVRSGSWRSWLVRFARNIPPARRISRYWYLLIGAPVYFATLRTACQLNLCGLLKSRPGLTRAEIAEALHIQDYPARVLLLTCVTIGLLKKRGDRYFNTLFCGSAFDADNPRSLVPYVEWIHQVTFRSMYYYTQAIQESRAAGLEVFEGDEDNLYARMARDPQLEECFQNMMARWSHASNLMLAERVRFSDFPRILDVGGGNGENLSVIARRHPAVTGTLLDFPTVAERARQRFEQEGIAERMHASGRNFLADDFPAGYSCVLFAHLTPVFSEATNRELMRKAYAALNPGGMLCICGPFMNDDETGPFTSALLSPYFLCTVNGRGRHYSMKETTGWVQEAGFENIEHCYLNANDRVLVATKPLHASSTPAEASPTQASMPGINRPAVAGTKGY